MKLKVSTRGQVPPFKVMDVMREANLLAANGRDILHLEVGQPSTGAPAGVIAAAQKAMAIDKLGYTNALGINSLGGVSRSIIVTHIKLTYQRSVL